MMWEYDAYDALLWAKEFAQEVERHVYGATTEDVRRVSVALIKAIEKCLDEFPF